MGAFDCAAAASGLLLIDVQERFLAAVPSIAPDQGVGRTLRLLLTAARLTAVPIIISEQYPKGLGATLPHLREAAPEAPCLAKMHFSCLGDPALRDAIAARARRTWVLCGIETHVCVLQTAVDLLSAGHEVVVASDGVDSRRSEHREAALATLRALGALVLPGEAVAMRWTAVAGTPLFKQISALIK
jgi:nicotinamidase-related amidase